jgi:hypothetical protein
METYEQESGVLQLRSQRLLAFWNVVFIEVTGPALKTLSSSLGKLCNIAMSFVLTFHILGFEPYSGSFRIMIGFSESILVQASRFASPDRIAVSFRS